MAVLKTWRARQAMNPVTSVATMGATRSALSATNPSTPSSTWSGWRNDGSRSTAAAMPGTRASGRIMPTCSMIRPTGSSHRTIGSKPGLSAWFTASPNPAGPRAISVSHAGSSWGPRPRRDATNASTWRGPSVDNQATAG